MLKVNDLDKLKDYGFENFSGVYNLELAEEIDINTETKISLIVNMYDKSKFIDDHILRIYSEASGHSYNQVSLTAEFDVVFKMIQDGVVYFE
jgi:hypothetical protein